MNQVERQHGPRRVHEGPRPRPAGGRGEDVAEEEDVVERDQEHVPPAAADAQQVGSLPAVSDLPFNTCAHPLRTSNLPRSGKRCRKDLGFGLPRSPALEICSHTGV